MAEKVGEVTKLNVDEKDMLYMVFLPQSCRKV